jgi:ATP-binding cassette, subfamily B, multidrug efflux pump
LSDHTPNLDSAPPQADERWLGRYIWKYKRQILYGLLSGLVAGVTAAASPYLIGAIIDQVRQGIDMAQIVNGILLLVTLTIISLIAFFGQRTFSGTIAYGVNYDIRRDLFDQMLLLEQRFYQDYTTGDLMSRMYADLNMIWRLLLIGFTRFGSAIFTLVTAFVLLAMINLPLTLLVFTILTVSTTIQLRVGTFLAPIFEKVQDQAGELSTQVQDAVSGIQTIKTFGREAGAAQQYRAANIEYRRRWLRFERYNEPVGMLPNAISETTAATVVVLGGIMTLQGILTVGNFVQFLLYLGTISVVLLQLGTIYQRYQQTRGALMRLSPMLRPPTIREEETGKPLADPQGEITFENVGVKIGDNWLLRDISLHIPAGQTVAIVGPTGGGKTLLVSLLARILDPDEGRILIDGIDIKEIRLSDLRRAIAYVPQSTFLFSQPLHLNVRMGKPDVSEEMLHSAVHISRLSNDLPQLPMGLDTLVGERGVMLSGGQKQRVAIARAIVRDPSILVLDDALSSVDTQTAADILADLRGVLHTRTSLIIAHRVATVRDADLIIVLKDGRIIEQGTHDNLTALGGHYTHMVERELRMEDEDLLLDEEQGSANELQSGAAWRNESSINERPNRRGGGRLVD